jgi:hypothetical protein
MKREELIKEEINQCLQEEIDWIIPQRGMFHCRRCSRSLLDKLRSDRTGVCKYCNGDVE